ncbi:uncharacterized protein I206_103459 [Kwoniella pini CBS 10737]|uniref:MaoC-like domain-containing protein n=1 Tax=Kwoniella pini CBS 10737 TaxID=1296096 RepID=A0A1B9I9F3_9TREE|nr:uncharacterized protein I206_01538 [Kwoniella pini CBS 10737]OCF52252.1 hypothetical protein I206_01538 [Kwoniella pini CBS 10737]
MLALLVFRFVLWASVFYAVKNLIQLTPLLSKTKLTQISFSTRELSGIKIPALLIYHIIRSILRRIGIGSKLNIIEESDGSFKLKNGDITLYMPFKITNQDIQQYVKCISSNTKTNNNLTEEMIFKNSNHLQLLLSSLTEPTLLLLLSKINCQIDPIGSVNVRNKFELFNFYKIQQLLLSSSLSQNFNEINNIEFQTIAKLNENVKKVKRGWEFNIIIKLIENNLNLNLKSKLIFKQSFTFLTFYKHFIPLPSIPLIKSDRIKEDFKDIGNFKINIDEPIKWSKLSKDYNPIHTFNLAAKLLGFKSKIAHGNHIVVKAIHEVSKNLTSESVSDKNEKRWMEIEFKRPVPVPSTLELKMYKQNADEERTNLEIWVKGKVATTVTCNI